MSPPLCCYTQLYWQQWRFGACPLPNKQRLEYFLTRYLWWCPVGKAHWTPGRRQIRVFLCCHHCNCRLHHEGFELSVAWFPRMHPQLLQGISWHVHVQSRHCCGGPFAPGSPKSWFDLSSIICLTRKYLVWRKCIISRKAEALFWEQWCWCGCSLKVSFKNCQRHVVV